MVLTTARHYCPAMRIVLVVPGGVDPPGAPRTIPFIHHLVESMSADHQVTVLAVGHDPHPGEWRLFDADVINIPIGEHSKGDILRVVTSATRAASRGGRPDVVHGLWANLPGLVAGTVGRRHGAPVVVSVGGGEFARVPDIGYGGGLHAGTRRLAGAAVRLATTVTVATEWMRTHLAADGIAVDEVIPLGADTRIFHSRPAQVRPTPTVQPNPMHDPSGPRRQPQSRQGPGSAGAGDGRARCDGSRSAPDDGRRRHDGRSSRPAGDRAGRGRADHLHRATPAGPGRRRGARRLVARADVASRRRTGRRARSGRLRRADHRCSCRPCRRLHAARRRTGGRADRRAHPDRRGADDRPDADGR